MEESVRTENGKSLIGTVREWGGLLPHRMVPSEWEYFRARSMFRVEQERFPFGLPEWTGGVHPCTDGETVWIPKGASEVCISLLLHETAHALLHYPAGPNPNFVDPVGGLSSTLEAEACAAAYLAAQALDQAPLHNGRYLAMWEGDREVFGKDCKERVVNAAREMVGAFSGVSEAA